MHAGTVWLGLHVWGMVMNRVALYARVSTDDQEPENQLRDLRAYCAQRGWTVSAEYVDKGISGAKDRRPSLDRMMAACRAREHDAVLVWRFDRFGRSVIHLCESLEEFRALGVAFVSTMESVDTSTAHGQLMFGILAAFAQFERALIRERIMSGLSRARAQGKVPGRHKGIDADERDARIRMLLQSGASIAHAAQVTGCSRATVRRVLNAMRAAGV